MGINGGEEEQGTHGHRAENYCKIYTKEVKGNTTEGTKRCARQKGCVVPCTHTYTQHTTHSAIIDSVYSCLTHLLLGCGKAYSDRGTPSRRHNSHTMSAPTWSGPTVSITVSRDQLHRPAQHKHTRQHTAYHSSISAYAHTAHHSPLDAYAHTDTIAPAQPLGTHAHAPHGRGGMHIITSM